MLSKLLNQAQHSLSPEEIRSIADVLHGHLAGDLSALLSEAQRICWATGAAAEASDSQTDQRGPRSTQLAVEHLRAAALRVRPSGKFGCSW
jgi:hypothetical protein